MGLVGLVAAIRTRLRAAPPSQWPDFETTARALRLSTSTLRHRLRQEGRSWNGIRDEIRRDLAIEALTAGERGVAEIAGDLGFAEAYLRHEWDSPDLTSFLYLFSVNIEAVLRIHAHFRGRCKVGFGIGTNLTNDVGPKPLQLVLKMVRCHGQPVAKVSDKPGKGMSDDPDFVAYLRKVFGLSME